MWWSVPVMIIALVGLFGQCVYTNDDRVTHEHAAAL